MSSVFHPIQFLCLLSILLQSHFAIETATPRSHYQALLLSLPMHAAPLFNRQLDLIVSMGSSKTLIQSRNSRLLTRLLSSITWLIKCASFKYLFNFQCLIFSDVVCNGSQSIKSVHSIDLCRPEKVQVLLLVCFPCFRRQTSLGDRCARLERC